MDEATQAQFVSITGASPSTATQYLQLAEGNLEGAIEIFYANDGASLEQSTQASQTPPIPPPSTRPPGHRHSYEDDQGIVHIDSDGEAQQVSDDDGVQVTGEHQRRGSSITASALHTPVATPPLGGVPSTTDDDEAMARRLQEEFYGGGALGAANGRGEVLDEHGYRAPIGRTTETLVGPGTFDPSNPEEMRAAVMQQMIARQQRHSSRDRPGIFNQATGSIWNDADPDPRAHRDRLFRATGGASEGSSKANTLAEMYRPPFELMSRLPWDEARDQGKKNQKWILVNIQDPSIFDCQLLNRDIWKNPGIMETVKENFIFMQYSKDDQRGNQYVQYYFQNKDYENAYPHIAIVDPRTGEQVKVWSGPPAPKASDFLMQLHEFLDRYSLNASVKNPVAKRKPEVKKEAQVENMTEEQQLEMAMRASLAGTVQTRSNDPDDLTRGSNNSEQPKAKGAARTDNEAEMSGALETPHPNGTSEEHPSTLSPFASISTSNPHTEPASTEANTTRIQFRHPNGRVVRRFSLSDPVRRIYEWLKATPLEGKAGLDFELVFMQRNLIDSLDESIESAGLRNGTVMVEILEPEG
ncbi:MAG: hypothetical protein Q9217_003734 [Psora testacea]